MDKEISQNKVQRWLKKAIDQPAKMELEDPLKRCPKHGG